ncbi:conserved hypothetical protein [Methanosalsum zhilinae DSM 4017]|uniref:TIGR00725 family protein n=1 Tax=Methanosalsum zhilinae (strain DSM 4017 / NBRC 107636 / OCM 62 / WeN5) TaxID=679901 RepID=F7XKA1_METZD|nr:TIGR00725 family protein [Methanosalsum zhilinae]AEH60569.1 conserved hypothetical protein [Methanosalsum zhilinae DSM 4017]
MKKPHIGIIGAGACSTEVSRIAEEVGKNIAEMDAILICGGLGGVMEAASRGAKINGGTTVGILPGENFRDANEYIDTVIVTNMGHARNALIAHSSDALIAVDGEYGTLSEIALGLKIGKPVIALNSQWKIRGVRIAFSANEAVKMAFESIHGPDHQIS